MNITFPAIDGMLRRMCKITAGSQHNSCSCCLAGEIHGDNQKRKSHLSCAHLKAVLHCFKHPHNIVRIKSCPLASGSMSTPPLPSDQLDAGISIHAPQSTCTASYYVLRLARQPQPMRAAACCRMTDFAFTGKTGETLTQKPGTINGYSHVWQHHQPMIY